MPTTTRATRVERAPTPVVERLVELACLAPSVHNTQPWLWRYDGTQLVLEADLVRRLPVADPRGRNLTLSCGAALHHLQFAARALGWEAWVERMPAGRGDTVLAEVVVGRAAPAKPVGADVELLRARCTDRRRFTAWPVPLDRLRDLCAITGSWDVRAEVVADDAARFRLELLANSAVGVLEVDQRWRAEQEQWIDPAGPEGIPLDVLPSDPEPLQARSRFRPGLLEDTRLAIHGGERVIALGGGLDDVGSWLRTGEAMSALWLEATREGMSVVPMSQVIEVESTRREVRDTVLAGGFEPHLLLRVGWQAIGRRELPRTPRRPLREVLVR
ncbi:MAG TPA: hypothetical protein VNT31_11205 [Nocardioides sp.]|nr:hypothetical protein [Nocardioides sp.]